MGNHMIVQYAIDPVLVKKDNDIVKKKIKMHEIEHKKEQIKLKGEHDVLFSRYTTEIISI